MDLEKLSNWLIGAARSVRKRSKAQLPTVSPDGSSSKYGPGDRVRVRGAYAPDDVATPTYVRGKFGFVESVQTALPSSKGNSVGGGRKLLQAVYRIRLQESDVWPDRPAPGVVLCIDICEDQLESA
jgi:nitrile hydratase subunit beta